jgi:hypothetical protein
LDDIIIHSQGWEEQLTRLQAVLDVLIQAKCQLGIDKVEYLGYLIGHVNVKPQKKKVQPVCDWPMPQGTGQVLPGASRIL